MAASAQGFPRQARLLSKADYQYVFDAARPLRSRHLTLLFRPSPAGVPRLGLAIAKRHIRRASDRNRIKRTAREAFRLRRAGLPAVDLIVLVRPGAADLDCRVLRREMDMLLDRLE